jgi:hypothetical protein
MTNKKISLISQTAAAADITGSEAKNIPGNAQNCIGVIKTANTNGATTVAGKIQHSPDGASWADYITFTSIVGTNSFEVKYPTNQPILPHVRAIATITGATKLADVTIDLWVDC